MLLRWSAGARLAGAAHSLSLTSRSHWSGHEPGEAGNPESPLRPRSQSININKYHTSGRTLLQSLAPALRSHHSHRHTAAIIMQLCSSAAARYITFINARSGRAATRSAPAAQSRPSRDRASANERAASARGPSVGGVRGAEPAPAPCKFGRLRVGRA